MPPHTTAIMAKNKVVVIAVKKAIACIEQDVACCLFLFYFISYSRKLERERRKEERKSKQNKAKVWPLP